MDALGSVTSITDSGGGLRSEFRYASYGATSSSSDQLGDPYGYVGQTFDGASGLDALGARFYDPTTGRFLSPDPLGGGYAYAGDNPVDNVDPSGMMFARMSGGGAPSSTGPICTTILQMLGKCTPLPGDNAIWYTVTSTGGITSTVSGGTGGGGAGSPAPIWSPTSTGPSPYVDCTREKILFLAGVALAVVGLPFDPNLFGDAGLNSAALGLGVVSAHGIIDILVAVFGFAWWLIWNVILPHTPWWDTLGVLVKFGSNLTPLGATILAISLGVSIGWGLAQLHKEGCFL